MDPMAATTTSVPVRRRGGAPTASASAAAAAVAAANGDANAALDVDDELAQLLKEQEAFMRQNTRPAAKIHRMPGPMTAAEVREHEHTQQQEQPAAEAPEAPSRVVGGVIERDVIEIDLKAQLPPRAAAGGFPAATRRTGESLFGRRRRQQQQQPLPAAPSSSGLSGRGRLVDQVPVIGSATTTTRSDVVSEREWAEIDETNTATIAGMTPGEIRAAQDEIRRMLDPDLLAKLTKRHQKTATTTTPTAAKTMAMAASGTDDEVHGRKEAIQAPAIDVAKVTSEDELFAMAQRLPPEERAKHEWMQPVAATAKPETTTETPVAPGAQRRLVTSATTKRATSSERFDFDGERIVPTTIKTSGPGVQSGLYHHGDEPEAPGYTMDELLHLARSTVASQRAMALVTISKILKKRQVAAATEGAPCYPAVLPRQLPVALRMALDDQNYTALGAAITALHAFLVPVSVDNDADIDVVSPPTIHVHVDAGVKREELLREVIYIDTGASTEDGSVISDEELAALDPVQGCLKMNLIPRLTYIVGTIQLPDEDALGKLLELLVRIARHSPMAARAIMGERPLVQALQKKCLEDERVLTLQVDQDGGAFERAVGRTNQALVLVRALCQADRDVASKLMEWGVIQSTKGFLAFKGPQAVALEPLQLESLQIWRVLLGYGLDFHSFAYMYPLLCGFDGVQLVQATETGLQRWSDRCLAALFRALEAFTRLEVIHEAQHYFSQLAIFLDQARDEVGMRLSAIDGSDRSSRGHHQVVVLSALQFLTAGTRLVAKFHLDRACFTAVQGHVKAFLRRGDVVAAVSRTPHGRRLILSATRFAAEMVRRDLLQDDEDDEGVLRELLQRLRPIVGDLVRLEPGDTAGLSEALVFLAELIVRADDQDEAMLRVIYRSAVGAIQWLPTGHQFWVHALFRDVLFHPRVLQKTGLFEELGDAMTMSRVLIPIYQALVNGTDEQDKHSRATFAMAGTTDEAVHPRERRSWHLVLPEDEHTYAGSNLPLPFFWLFCPFSRLEYASSHAAQDDTNGPRSPTPSQSSLDPSRAQADEMKVIVSAACRFIYQFEQVLGDDGLLVPNSPTDNTEATAALGDEDKLFHLMHVFFAGADVLFDDHVDLALTKLLPKYATRVIEHAGAPTLLFDGLLRNLRRFEDYEADAPADVGRRASTEAPAPSRASSSFASDTETVQAFVERLVHEFTSTSFGNVLFARTITLFLVHDLPASTRAWVWKELAESHMLHRLEAFGVGHRDATGHRCTRDATRADERLVRAMASALTRRELPLTPDRGPLAYWIAVHHLVVYVFGIGTTTTTMSFSRQQLVQELLRRADPMRTTLWRHLLSYDLELGFRPAQQLEAPIRGDRLERIRSEAGLTGDQVDAFEGLVQRLESEAR